MRSQIETGKNSSVSIQRESKFVEQSKKGYRLIQKIMKQKDPRSTYQFQTEGPRTMADVKYYQFGARHGSLQTSKNIV